jgi:hypothetical protein
VTTVEGSRNGYRILVGSPEGKDQLRNWCVDGRIILKKVLNRQVMRM